MPTLLDSLTSLATPAVGQIATRLGENEAAVTRALPAGIASVLSGIIAKSNQPASIRQIFEMVISHPSSANLTADVQGTAATLAPGAPTGGAAGTLLSILFGGRANAVGEMVARAAGFKNPSSGGSMLGVAAPLVLASLGKSVRDRGLSVGGLATLLSAERAGILDAAPYGLTNIVDLGAAAAASTALRGTVVTGRPSIGAAPAQGSRWFWPLVGAAAVAVVAWLALTRQPATVAPPITTATTALDTAVMQAGQAVRQAAGEVSSAAGSLGAFVKRALPGGVTLTVPERGIESKLIAFIEDRSRPVNDTTWFDFDRLNFASGSATILPTSQEQLDNIVAVLKAYPGVNVKVGGYTDDVGSEATNMRLSQQRAEAVMRALVKAGIPASRLQAEGYGEQHPVADNATDEGRARNRRIALRVTKK